MNASVVRQGLRSGVRLPWIFSLGVLVVTVAVFAPILGYDFVVWDDDLHVYANPRLQALSWDAVASFWRASYAQLYVPLTYTVWAAGTWLSQVLHLRPLWAELLHSVNLICHLGSVWVIYQLGQLVAQHDAAAMTTRQTLAVAAGALVFGIHPLQVEAVAWVSGLKDVLCGWWALVAVWQYGCAVQAQTRAAWWRHYGVATVAYGLALLAKPTAVMVPALTAVVAIGGLRQPWWAAGRALGGWLVVAIAWSVGSKELQPDSLLEAVPTVTERVVVAVDAVGWYVAKLLWPVQFAPDYGRTPQVVLAQGWSWLASWGLVGGMLGLCWWGWRCGLGLAVGVFAVGLLPSLGLVSFAFQAYSTVADRYTYLAFGGVALGVSAMLRRWGHRGVVWGLCAIVLILLAWRSIQQVAVWHDTTTLFTHTLQVNPHSTLAHNNLGLVRAQQDDLDQAIRHFRSAIALKPSLASAHYNLGKALTLQGVHDQAIVHYMAALQQRPQWAEAHNNLGIALAAQGKYNEAMAHYAQALMTQPENADVYYNMGHALSSSGRTADAIAAYRTALRWRPAWLPATLSLAWLLVTEAPSTPHTIAEAVTLAEQACRATDYRDALGLRTLAAAYYAADRYTDAIQAAQHALALATTHGRASLAAEIEAQLSSYTEGHTVHERP